MSLHFKKSTNKFFRKFLTLLSVFALGATSVEAATSTSKGRVSKTRTSKNVKARGEAVQKARIARGRSVAPTKTVRTRSVAPRTTRTTAPTRVAPTRSVTPRTTRTTAPTRVAPTRSVTPRTTRTTAQTRVAPTRSVTPRTTRTTAQTRVAPTRLATPRTTQVHTVTTSTHSVRPHRIAPIKTTATPKNIRQNRQTEVLRQQQVAEQQRQAEVLRQQQVEQTRQEEVLRQQQIVQQQRQAKMLYDQAVQQVGEHFRGQNFAFNPLEIPTRMTIGEDSLPEDFPIRDLGYEGRLARSAQYGMNMPTAPIIHPYDLEGQGTNKGYEQPAFFLNVKLPRYLAPLFPETLNRHLTDFNPENIDVYWEVQDMPWTVLNEATKLSLKPQSWLDEEAPLRTEGYNKSFSVQAGIFGGNFNQIIEGQPVEELLTENRISTHSGEGNLIVSSGNVLHINNLDLDRTNHFYSLTKNLANGRAAVVIHDLLNPADAVVFQNVLQESNTPEELYENIGTVKGTKVFSKDFEEDFGL